MNDHNTLVTWGSGFPRLDLPRKVLEVKSQESGEVKGYCVWSQRCLPGGHHGNPFHWGILK